MTSRSHGSAIRNTGLLVLVIAACTEGPLVESTAVDSPASDSTVTDTLVPPASSADTALSVRVDGRTLVWSIADTGATIYLQRGLVNNNLYVVGARGVGDAREVVEVSLNMFTGVGAYPLDDANLPSGVGVYGHGDTSWWTSGHPIDTAWVTAYDSVTGRIEGTFGFTGVAEGMGSVVVDSGHFKGVVRELPAGPPDCVSDSLVGDCHVYDPTPCHGTVNASQPDTAVGALVNGNRWVMSSSWQNNWSHVETRTGPVYLTIGGGLRTASIGGTGERLQVWVYGFKGPGVYPMSRTPTMGHAYGYYTCASESGWADADGFVPLGWAGDEVVVSAWDSVTGEVAGTFQFKASKFDGTGAGVRVTSGTFHLNVPIY